MFNEKLESWAKKLLDTGLRNNLVNFKENKGSLEIVSHSGSELFELLDKGARLEVFDPKKENDKDFPKTMSRDQYVESFKHLLKKNVILAYNKADANSIRILKNIDKKADTSINETGVNIAYMAIGFMNWLESDSSTLVHRAPLLLVPISILFLLPVMMLLLIPHSIINSMQNSIYPCLNLMAKMQSPFLMK